MVVVVKDCLGVSSANMFAAVSLLLVLYEVAPVCEMGVVSSIVIEKRK